MTVVTKAAGEPQLRWTSEEARHTRHGFTTMAELHHGYTYHGYIHLPWLRSLWQARSYSISEDSSYPYYHYYYHYYCCYHLPLLLTGYLHRLTYY